MNTLKPFQIEDIARAALRDSAIISWEQGLGKSLAAIAFPTVKEARRTLIIAPASLHLQLQQSAARFFNVSLRRLRNIQEFYALRLHLPPSPSQPPRFFLTSFQEIGLNGADEHHRTFGTKGLIKPNTNLEKLRKSWLQQHRIPCPPETLAAISKSIGRSKNNFTCVWSPSLARLAAETGAFDCVVIDEGTRIQASESRMADSIRLLNPRFRLVLTGTPIKNRLESIFWLAAWTAQERWPYPATDDARKAFAQSFLQTERFITREELKRSTGEKPSDTTRLSNRICQIHQLWKILSPIIIRRRKTDCGESIPPKIMKPIIVPPGSAQLIVYQHHLDNPPIRSASGAFLHRRVQVANQLTLLRLAALCPSAESLGRSKNGFPKPMVSWTEFTPKFQAVLSIIQKNTAAGHQTIVGSPFREFSQTLYNRIHSAGIPCSLLDGRVPPEQRAIAATAFKSGHTAVLIAGIKAMGEGHSFENCRHLILPALSFAYDENEQFIHRIWRLNSPGPVTIYPIITSGTIDTRLHEIFTEKADSASIALDGRLFTDPSSNPDVIDPERILAAAIADFNPRTPTTEERLLVDLWESRTERLLVSAADSYAKHRFQITTAQHLEATAAAAALKIPSPTQAAITIIRKHQKAGTYRIPTQESIKKALAKFKSPTKQKKRKNP